MFVELSIRCEGRWSRRRRKESEKLGANNNNNLYCAPVCFQFMHLAGGEGVDGGVLIRKRKVVSGGSAFRALGEFYKLFILPETVSNWKQEL